MINKERVEWIRTQAIICLELTKGFTPEQRDNSIKTIEELGGFVVELIQELLDIEKLPNINDRRLYNFLYDYYKLSESNSANTVTAFRTQTELHELRIKIEELIKKQAMEVK